MIRKILDATDPVLRMKAKPVKVIDKKVRRLAQDLIDTLRVQSEPEGVGLAACQIGKPVSMFAMKHKSSLRIIINPKIVLPRPSSNEKDTRNNIPVSKKEKTILEGCLSIPYLYGPLKRPRKLKLNFKDLKNESRTETFEGFSAQIIQHEIDHLNGKLFTDRILKKQLPLYKHNPKTNEFEEVDLI